MASDLLSGLDSQAMGRVRGAGSPGVLPHGVPARWEGLIYDTDGLHYAGKVGTGYDEKTLRSLRRRLDDLVQDSSPFVTPVNEPAHWVRPELVAEVGFGEWTRDGKLRHPRHQGLRADKAGKDVVRETR